MWEGQRGGLWRARFCNHSYPPPPTLPVWRGWQVSPSFAPLPDAMPTPWLPLYHSAQKIYEHACADPHWKALRL